MVAPSSDVQANELAASYVASMRALGFADDTIVMAVRQAL